MRIALLIDSLASGGAQRQIVELATGMKERGHSISLGVYHRSDFFINPLEREEIKIIELKTKNKLGKVLKVRNWLKSFKPNIVQSYLTNPNAVAVLASLGERPWKVVVSERSTPDCQSDRRYYIRAKRQTYRFADWVITNSHSNMVILHKYLPILKGKSSVIWNGVDLDKFHPLFSEKPRDTFQFICVASVWRRKNVLRIIEAIDLLRKKKIRSFGFRWVGRFGAGDPDMKHPWEEPVQRIKSLGLNDIFTFTGESNNVQNELQSADALVLCSLYEGFPNAICEGMASGLPIVASKISDIPRIVEDGVNGFLCDPTDVSSITGALERCLALSKEDQAKFGNESRRRAEKMLSKEKFLNEYESLYNWLLNDM